MEEYRNFRHLEYHICDHCNLNCKGCFHNAPLVKEPKFRTVEEFKNDISQIKKFIPNNIPFGITLLGGEPLLHPDIIEFIKVSIDIIPVMGITTNGILLKKQSQEFFDLINKYNISITWSNYYDDPEIKDILDHKVKNVMIFDAKYLLNPNYNFNANYSKEIIEQCYFNCGNIKDHSNCYTLRDGYIYKCAWDAWADYLFNYFNFIPKNYIRDHNRLNIYDVSSYDDFINFMNTPSEFCNYCVDAHLFKGQPSVPWGPSKKELGEWTGKIDE